MTKYKIELDIEGDFPREVVISRLNRLMSLWDNFDPNVIDYEFRVHEE